MSPTFCLIEHAYVLRQCKAWHIQKAVRIKLNTSNTDIVLFGNVFIGEMKIGNVSGYLIQKRIGTVEGTWREMILFTEGIMAVGKTVYLQKMVDSPNIPGVIGNHSVDYLSNKVHFVSLASSL